MIDMIFGRVIANKIRIKFSFLKPILSQLKLFFTWYGAKVNDALDNLKLFNIFILLIAPISVLAWILSPITIISSIFTATFVYLAYRIVTFK